MHHGRIQKRQIIPLTIFALGTLFSNGVSKTL